MWSAVIARSAKYLRAEALRWRRVKTALSIPSDFSFCFSLIRSFIALSSLRFLSILSLFHQIILNISPAVHPHFSISFFSISPIVTVHASCPVTEFAVASHFNTANSCCHHGFLTALSVPKVPTRVQLPLFFHSHFPLFLPIFFFIFSNKKCSFSL